MCCSRFLRAHARQYSFEHTRLILERVGSYISSGPPRSRTILIHRRTCQLKLARYLLLRLKLVLAYREPWFDPTPAPCTSQDTAPDCACRHAKGLTFAGVSWHSSCSRACFTLDCESRPLCNALCNESVHNARFSSSARRTRRHRRA